jgi:hypothetical protein
VAAVGACCFLYCGKHHCKLSCARCRPCRAAAMAATYRITFHRCCNQHVKCRYSSVWARGLLYRKGRAAHLYLSQLIKPWAFSVRSRFLRHALPLRQTSSLQASQGPCDSSLIP